MSDLQKNRIRRLATTGAALLALASAGKLGAQEVEYDFYGYVMMDAIYDFDRVNPDWKDTLRPSQIPVNCPGDAGCGTSGETIFSVRQTRFGMTADIPTGLGKVKTKLEFELFGVGPDAGKVTPRLRHAWAELGQYGVGQTWSVFMDPDVFPNTIDYWGPAGMIFFRNVQLRWTPVSDENQRIAVALESPSSGIDSGKVADIAPSLDVRGKSKLPDLTAHWRVNRDWGHMQVAGILRQIGYETTSSANGKPSGEETGFGVNLSGSFNMLAEDKLLWQFVYGEGIANYFNDGGVDLAPNAALNAEAVPILGWLLFYNRSWNDKWSSSIGWSSADLDNRAGQRDDAFDVSQYGLVNLLHYPAENIMVGAEFLHGKLELKDGSSGTDTRLQFSAKFSF